MKKLFAIALTLALPLHAAAASETIHETDTQFEASQAVRAEAFAAFRSGDQTLALSKMEEALTHRPGNVLLLGYIAFLAAETGDTARAVSAAEAYAATGNLPGGAILGKLQEKLPADNWAKLEAAFKANAEPVGAPKPIINVPTDVKLVEGIALGQDGDIYLSSVVSGAIYRMNGAEPVLLADGKALGMGSFFGIAFDKTHNSLFATYGSVDQTSGPAEGSKTGVAEFDASSGQLKNNWVLSDDTKAHQVADILIDDQHTVYVSDATGKAVYRVNGNDLEKTFDLPNSMSPQGLAKLNGTLYLADYGRGIWKLDETTNSSILLGRTANMNLVGIDGMVAHEGKLLAIQNGGNPHRLIAIEVNELGNTVSSIDIMARGNTAFDEPTLGVSKGDEYYFVAGSQWPKFGKGGALKDGAALVPTSIQCLCK